MLKDGFLAGVFLYLTVAVFFAVINLLGGRSLFGTAAVLGEAFLGVPTDPLDPSPSGPAIVAFNGLHLVGSLVLGLAAALLAGAAVTTGFLWWLHARRPEGGPGAH